MKILIINFEYPPLGGGGGVATRDIGEELAPRHEVHILTSHFKGLAKYERVNGVHIHRASAIGRHELAVATLVSMICFAVSATWRGWRLCQRHRFDVINAQFVVPSGIPASIVARRFRIPLVISFIGGDVYDPSKGVSPHRHGLLRYIIRFIAQQAVIGTAISNDIKTKTQELHGVTLPIIVTSLGLKVSRVPAVSRAVLGISEQSFLFVSIGRLIPRKGYEVLLRAWRQLPMCELRIIGEGPLQGKLQAMIDDWQLKDRVKLLGFVSEETKQQLLQVADAYISGANHEGFGIVFLEAMAAGLPIVATNNGGHTDFLTPNVNALLVAPNDPAAIRKAVTALFEQVSVRQELRQENLKKVQEYYLPKTTAVFEGVLQKAAATKL